MQIQMFKRDLNTLNVTVNKRRCDFMERKKKNIHRTYLPIYIYVYIYRTYLPVTARQFEEKKKEESKEEKK